MTKTRQVNTRLSDRLAEMIQQIKEDKGFLSEAEAIRHAIVVTHRKYFPSYSKSAPDIKSAEDKEREKKERKEAKKRVKEKEYTRICEDVLGGEVIEKEGGKKVCKYFTYKLTDRFAKEVPIEMVREDLADTQYSPSKEKVQELIAKGKVNYEI